MSSASLPRAEIFQTQMHVLHSQRVGQAFELGVRLPFSYASTERRYPVLYLPDGECIFPMVTGLMPSLVGLGEVPEMIVVGVSYHNIAGWAEFLDLRNRDYLPQSILDLPGSLGGISRQAQYIAFYEQELFPFIEGAYRVDASERAVFGFSSSAFFAIDMLFNHPGLFRRHIAASLSGADVYFLDRIQDYAQLPQRPAVDVFLAAGELESEVRADLHKVVDALKAIPEVRVLYEVYEGEGHSAGTMAKTFLHGLKSIYK